MKTNRMRKAKAVYSALAIAKASAAYVPAEGSQGSAEALEWTKGGLQMGELKAG